MTQNQLNMAYLLLHLLTNCAFQLFFGKIYSFYSTKWVFLIALGIFELGSLLCGAAPTSVALILGRAVAGLGAAGIMTGALLIISQNVPLKSRAVYTSAICSVSAVSGDVANVEDLQRAVSASPRPISGVIQMSMVLKVTPSSYLHSSVSTWGANTRSLLCSGG